MLMCEFCSEPDTAHDPDCPAVTGNWSDFSDEELEPTGYTRDVCGEPARTE